MIVQNNPDHQKYNYIKIDTVNEQDIVNKLLNENSMDGIEENIT